MRALLAAATIGLLSVPTVSAQTTFGLKAGLNVANLSFDDDEDVFGIDGIDKQPRLGVVAGVFADVALTPALSFHPEVLYSQKGFKASFDVSAEGVDFEGSITQKIDYVEVPLLLSYRIPAGQNGLMFGIEAGPTLAYKLSTGISCGGDFEEFCDDFDDSSFDDETRDFDIGGALGLTVGAGPFGVGARFTQGFTTVDDPENEADAIDARNQVFSLTGTYTFGR